MDVSTDYYIRLPVSTFVHCLLSLHSMSGHAALSMLDYQVHLPRFDYPVHAVSRDREDDVTTGKVPGGTRT